MVFTKHKMFAPAVLITCLLVFSASPILAQDTTNPAGSRTVASGQKMKLKGVVTRRDADTFTVRDMNGVDTVVRLERQDQCEDQRWVPAWRHQLCTDQHPSRPEP